MAFVLTADGAAMFALSFYGDSAHYDTIIDFVYANSASDLGRFSLYGRWNTPTGGQVSLSAPQAFTYLGAGTLSAAKVNSAGGTYLADGTIGLIGSGSDAIVNSTTSSSSVTLTNFTILAPTHFGTASLNSTLRTAIVSAFTDVDGDGLGPAVALLHPSNPTLVRLYSGVAPIDADAAATGTVLATFSLLNTNFTVPTTETISLASSVSASGSVTGTAGYARITAANGCTIQCSVGTGAGDIVLSTLSVVSGVSLDVTSIDITLG